MRRLLASLAVSLAASLALALPIAAVAQIAPPKLEPIPEPPPAPIGIQDDTAGPDVTLQRGDKVEEWIDDTGQRYIRVTQPNGWVYYLVEAQAGDGPFAGTQNSDSRIRPPMWQILQW